MEEVACECCAQDKGKGKQRAVVPDSLVLGSPIVLAQTSDPEEIPPTSLFLSLLGLHPSSPFDLLLRCSWWMKRWMFLCILPGSVGLWLKKCRGMRMKIWSSIMGWLQLSGSTSRELKDALDIQGGGLEQHWVFGSRVSWIWKPDHSCVTRAECEYPNQVGIEEGSFGYRREQVEMLGLTQERCSEMPEGKSCHAFHLFPSISTKSETLAFPFTLKP